MPRHGPTLRSIAEEAVYEVYEHGSGKDRAEYEAERELKATRFRSRYASEGAGLDGERQGNVAPTFIGVFDTVAALGSVIARRILWSVLAGSLMLAALTWWSGHPVVAAAMLIPAVVILLTLLDTARRQLKTIRDGPAGPGLSWHFARWNLDKYDRFLDTSVGYARHALAIDERRERFAYVPWGRVEDAPRMNDERRTRGEPLWLTQLWFAGNHSDIGGSYPEDESRLSDITLRWMIDELLAIPSPPRLNAHVLHTSGDHSAPQHDEVLASRYAWFPRWWPHALRFGWKPKLRAIKPGAKLHPSVVARLQEDLVSDYDAVRRYRPPNLIDHDEVRGFY